MRSSSQTSSGSAALVGALGERRTRQRERIVAALGESDQPLTARDLFKRINGGPSNRVSLATVYRTLNGLAEASLIDAVKRPSGETAYLACGRGHHHHLTCRLCGRVVEVRECDLMGWADAVAERHGFADTEHRVEIVGTCARHRGSRENHGEIEKGI